MMTKKFVRSGTIVTGDSFLGRDREISKVRDIIRRFDGTTQLSIEGVPHIGKSSLAYEAIMTIREELLEHRVLAVWINVGCMRHASEVLNEVGEAINAELFSAGLATSGSQEKYDHWCQSRRSSALARYLEWLRKKDGIRSIVVVLDEFDHVRNLESISPSFFQTWRDLAYMPETRIKYVLVSRRSINSIELKCGNSNFSNIFDRLSLRGFSAIELDKLEQLFEASFCDLRSAYPSLWQAISYWVGSHPYLLTNCAARAIEMAQSPKHELVLDELREERESFCVRFFHTEMRSFLDEVGLTEDLLKSLFGPRHRLDVNNVQLLKDYGLLTPPGGTISEAFLLYLEALSRTVSLWELWSETEVALRAFVVSQLINAYGDEWEAGLLKQHPKLCKAFEDMRRRQTDTGVFNISSSDDLLDYSYPGDLFAILFRRWDLFGAHLGHNKAYWQERLNVLSEVRKAGAHNRKLVGRPSLETIANGYCKEILELVGRS